MLCILVSLAGRVERQRVCPDVRAGESASSGAEVGQYHSVGASSKTVQPMTGCRHGSLDWPHLVVSGRRCGNCEDGKVDPESRDGSYEPIRLGSFFQKVRSQTVGDGKHCLSHLQCDSCDPNRLPACAEGLSQISPSNPAVHRAVQDR